MSPTPQSAAAPSLSCSWKLVFAAERLGSRLCSGASGTALRRTLQWSEFSAGQRFLAALRGGAWCGRTESFETLSFGLAVHLYSARQISQLTFYDWLRTWQGSIPLPLRMGPRWVRCVLERRQPPLPADSAELHQGCRVQRCRPNPQRGSSRRERTLSDFEGTLPLHREL